MPSWRPPDEPSLEDARQQPAEAGAGLNDDDGRCFMYDPEPTLPERMARMGVTKDGELD